MVALQGRPPYRPDGCLMIDTVEILNFRAFKEVKLSDCRLINVIVGENASGKTALLEGIFLAAGPSPEIAVRIKGFRGIERLPFEGTEATINEMLWRDLFNQFNTRKPAYISLSGKEQSSTRSVTVTYRDRSQLIAVPTPQPRDRKSKHFVAKPIEVELVPINFRWRWPHGRFTNVDPHFVDGKIVVGNLPDSNVDISFFAANRTYSIQETVNRFSALSRMFKERGAVNLFREHFPAVTDLSIESFGSQAMLYAQVNDLPEKIPLSMISSGMTKLAAILFAIPNQPHGVILIDEIENGFYYKRLPVLWRSLLSFAREYDCQIFASTHSAECLNALLEAAATQIDDVSLIRVEKSENASTLRQFSGKLFKAGMEMQGEIR
jgi:predicted ATPase